MKRMWRRKYHLVSSSSNHKIHTRVPLNSLVWKVPILHLIPPPSPHTYTGNSLCPLPSPNSLLQKGKKAKKQRSPKLEPPPFSCAHLHTKLSLPPVTAALSHLFLRSCLHGFFSHPLPCLSPLLLNVWWTQTSLPIEILFFASSILHMDTLICPSWPTSLSHSLSHPGSLPQPPEFSFLSNMCSLLSSARKDSQELIHRRGPARTISNHVLELPIA